jgi:hypothetical protein
MMCIRIPMAPALPVFDIQGGTTELFLNANVTVAIWRSTMTSNYDRNGIEVLAAEDRTSASIVAGGVECELRSFRSRRAPNLA